jgi:protein kinase-like protein
MITFARDHRSAALVGAHAACAGATFSAAMNVAVIAHLAAAHVFIIPRLNEIRRRSRAAQTWADDPRILQHVSLMTSVTSNRRVGRYELRREIGRGGSAVVYLAHQTDLDREVALKELAAFRASDPAFVERFLRESRLTGSLNHPNIVTVHEYFEHEGTAFIAMEYFERGSLRPLVSRLTLPQVAGVLDGLLSGLAYAETRGIVHRDLKPENVMVTSAGAVKIADFGMARARELETGSRLTDSGTTVGTPAYMAPEQALGEEPGPGADLYSVGVIAYELLAGRVPFDQAEPPMAIMLRHLNDAIPPLRSLDPDLDPELADWVERMLAKSAGDRPGSASDAADHLEEIIIRLAGPRWRRLGRIPDSPLGPQTLAERDGTASTPELVPTRAYPSRRRRAVVVALAIAAIVLAVTGIAAAVALTDESGATTHTTVSTELPESTQVTRPTGPAASLSGIALDDSDDLVTATMRFAGDPLGAKAIALRDADVDDGFASFWVRQPGIRAATAVRRYGPLSVRIRKAKGRLLVGIQSASGSFADFSVRRAGKHVVVVELRRPTPAETTATSPSRSGGTTTTPTIPNRPKKQQEKPVLGSE